MWGTGPSGLRAQVLKVALQDLFPPNKITVRDRRVTLRFFWFMENSYGDPVIEIEIDMHTPIPYNTY